MSASGLHSRRGFLRSIVAAAGAAGSDKLRALVPIGPAETAVKLSFSNRLASSGIGFKELNGASPRKLQIETMTGGVAMFDSNGDGLLDLYFVNGAALPGLDKNDPKFWNRLYRNNGDGTFRDVTEASGLRGAFYGMGAAAADYDNDGHQDLLVTGANGFQLFHNKGDGTFADVTEAAGLRRTHPKLANGFSVAAGWFDYDNDGLLDLLIINYLQWTVDTDVNCTSKGIRAYCSPNSYAGTPNLLFHNNGDGTFTDVTEQSGLLKHVGKGMGVAFADYDGDGFVDIFVANDSYRNFLFHNNGDGTFTETGILSGVAYNGTGKSVAGMGVDFRDLDNDGLPDAFLTAMHGDSFPLFHNEGKGFFEDRSSTAHVAAATSRLTAWGAGAYDFDNDGWKDLFTANAAILDNSEEVDHLPYRMANTLLWNNRDGSFLDVSASLGVQWQSPAAHRGAAFGDLNNDGRIDIVTNCLNGPPELWMNTTAPVGHWLLIALTGRRSNRDGLGTRIRVTTPSGTQTNQATTSVGYGSSSDKRVHFGLGPYRMATVVEVIWTSGTHQVLHNVTADQILALHEP